MGIFDRGVYIIFFYHVSSAWLSYFSFSVSLICHILYLKQKKIVWIRIGKSSVTVGVFFVAFTLITGSIWFNATSGNYQNVFWQWNDPRQTSTLILFISYLSYLIFGNLVEERDRMAKLTAIYGIVVFPTVPFSYLSAIIWSSFHPLINPSPGQGHIYWDSVKLFILFLNLISMTILFAYLVQEFLELEKKKEELKIIIQKRLKEE
jgi:heme exporter protein C